MLVRTALILLSFSAFGATHPSPISKEKAGELSRIIDKALTEVTPAKLPEAARHRVEALKLVHKQIEDYRQTGEVSKGLLTWFQDRFELTKEDGKYVGDIATLCALYVENLLKFHAEKIALADEKYLHEVKAKMELSGRSFTAEEVKDVAASLRMTETFRKTTKRRARRKLSQVANLLRTKCDVVAGFSDGDWRELRHEPCVVQLNPVFEAILDDKKPPPPLP